MKKKIILCIIAFIILGVSIFTVIHFMNQKVHLSNEYYKKRTNESYQREITGEKLEKLDQKTFILYVSGSNPNFSKIEDLIKIVEEKYSTQFVMIDFGEFKGTKYYPTIKYSSCFLIIQNGEVLDSLDLLDEKNQKYINDEQEFEKWLLKRVYLEKK